MVGMLAFEGVACVAAERFRASVDGIEGRSVAARRRVYERVGAWGALDLGLRLRVDDLLRERLVAIGEAVIADYRREQPTVGAVEWRQACEALEWARQLAPADRSIEARHVTCDAHVTRIAGQGQRNASQRRQLFESAVAKFARAAELDAASFDPYLGMSRTQVYGLDDVDAAAAAIEEAEKRGYESSRRERAQLGDGYLRSGEKSRRLARTLSGDQRHRELLHAQAAYTRCIAEFDPIVGFGKAAQNLEFCKRQLEIVSDELDAHPVEHD
jgi:hypothetical protein